MEDQSKSKSHEVQYTTEATNFLDSRRASTHASFFLPYIKADMNLLDCGCGTGSITMDLAEIVSSGHVTGIDINEKHLHIASEQAKKRMAENVQFEYGDVTDLSFADESFDAIFVHGVIEYVDAERAFLEIYRVLKKGGILGARHGDWGGFLIAPEKAELTENIELFAKLVAHNGGDPHCGRNQLASIRNAGFRRLKVSASYDCWTESKEATAYASNMLATYCLSSEFADPIIELGLSERARLEEMSLAFREWGKNENAFAAEAWGEVVAWKV